MYSLDKDTTKGLGEGGFINHVEFISQFIHQYAMLTIQVLPSGAKER